MPYANFAGAEFRGASLYGAYFNNADLTRAYFDAPVGADGRLIERERTDLRYAHFQGATAALASFRAADLRGANFTATKMRRTSLRGADFAGAILTGANFEGADLTDADFLGAKLDGVNLTGAILTGAKFPDASTRWPKNSATGAMTTVSGPCGGAADLMHQKVRALAQRKLVTSSMGQRCIVAMEDQFSEGRTCGWPTRIALRSGFHHAASKLPATAPRLSLRGSCMPGRFRLSTCGIMM